MFVTKREEPLFIYTCRNRILLYAHNVQELNPYIYSEPPVFVTQSIISLIFKEKVRLI